MMIKEYFINNLSKIETDWKRLEIGTEMTSFQTYDWSLLLLKDIKEKLLRSIFWKPVFVCHLNSGGEVDMIAPLVVQSKSLNLRFLFDDERYFYTRRKVLFRLSQLYL